MTPEALVSRWLELEGPEQAAFLASHASDVSDDAVRLMKSRANDHLRMNGRRALALAESILSAAALTRRPLHHAWALMALGNAYRTLGRYEEAISAYDQAHDLCTVENEAVEAARSQIGKILALNHLARYDEAFATAGRAHEVFLAHGEWLLAAQVQSNAANICRRQGDYRRALALYDEIRASFEAAGIAPTASDLIFVNELNRSLILRHLDRYREALASANEALVLATQLGFPAGVARAQDSLGLTYFFLGEYNRALDLFSRARQTFQHAEMPRDVLVVQLFEVECLLALNEHERAHALCAELVAACEAPGMWHEVALARVYDARALRGLGRLPAAFAQLDLAQHLFEEQQNRSWLAAVALERALLAVDLGDWGFARSSAADAYAGYSALELPVERAQAALALAQVYEGQRLAGRARELYQEALATGKQHGLGRLSAQAAYGLARLAAAAGDMAAAQSLALQAIDEVEHLRSHLAIDLRISFLADKLDLYEFATRLALDQNAAEDAFELVERARSRALVELLDEQGLFRLRARHEEDRALVDEIQQLREEQRWFRHRATRQPAYGAADAATAGQRSAWHAAARAREERLGELLLQLQIRNARYAEDQALLSVRTTPPQPHLRRGTLLIEYFALDDVLWAFSVSREDGTRAIPLDVDLPSVQRLLAALRLNMAQVVQGGADAGRIRANALGLLAKLYRALLAPLGPALDAARRLLVVPHGPLHYLPFQALFDGERHLVERLPLASLPSASVLRHLASRRLTEPGRLARGDRPGSGDSGSRYGALVLACSGDGRLPFTLVEARRVACGLGSRALLEEEATREALARHAPRSSILHLAAHGEFRPEAPLFSALHLADGPLSMLDIFDLRWPAELVTLSACESALGTLRPGEEIIGLSRACLHAGASALLLSLWRVEDESTAALMTAFYEYLLAGQTKAEALREAQLGLLGTSEYAHPYFWAPFVLVGDGHSRWRVDRQSSVISRQ